jgi:sulfinoalanine decarboxylase/sulfinoalanine decarboxylase/aspartate 1-decarboxylase
MLGTPLTCSIIVTQDKKHLYQSFSNDAEYLYQTADDDFNLGKTSFQCGRRNDALKIWTLWKSVGSIGLENIVNHQFYLADVARNYIRKHPDYTLHSFDNSISVCFNYKGISAKTLCTELYLNSEVLVGFGSFREDEFVRLVTINTSLNEQDILNFFERIETFVHRKKQMVKA